MGQKLQKVFYPFFLLISSFLVGGAISVAVAQISLDSGVPLEVRFSELESERNETSVTVSLSDIQSIFSEEFAIDENQWSIYSDVSNSNTHYFIKENNVSIAPGRIQVKNFPSQTFFISSFKNNSGFNIGNLIVAYDFIYNFFGRSGVPDFSLKYKVNDGEWKNIQAGVIESASLRSTEDAWKTFSIHLNIDDIFLRESDTIHLMWVIDETDAISTQIPMAVQRMEVNPQRMDQVQLNRGDLIITEILPRSDVNGSDFEYIEIYNPGEIPASLKGIEVLTSLGSKVIQKDIYINPYDFAVISNVDISSLESVRNSYFYNGSIIDANGGRVELERDGDLIASATYESTETGLAVELGRVAQAFDGYSSLQHFIPSQTSYYQDLYGSPGYGGGTSVMYTKELVKRGFYILSFPGVPTPRLNRHSSALEYYTLEGDRLTIESIEPHQLVLLYKTVNDPIKIYVEAESNHNVSEVISSRFTSNSSFLSIPVVTDGFRSTARQKIESLSRAVPVTQKWDQQQEKFTLETSNQIQGGSSSWTPSVLNSSVSNLIEISESRVTSPVLDRFVEFTMIPENNSTSSRSDIAILGFMDSPSQHSQLRYDLPKLKMSENTTSNDPRRHSLLYLTSTLSDESYNSFTHLPFHVDQEYEVGLGIDMADNSGGAVVEWKLNNNIPDEWVITIEDTYNGSVINLREENEYRFRYSNSNPSDNLQKNEASDTPRIVTLTPQNRPRFLIRVEPYESFSEVTEEVETPDSIELRPNYPNPFNPTTNINFFLPEEREVRVGIYNIVGQQVAVLLDDTVQQGEHSLVWDASNKPSGIYIVQLESGNRIFTRKITLIK